MMHLFARLAGLMSFNTIYRVADLLAPLVSVLYRRKMVTKNLKKAFPEKSGAEIAEITGKFYRNMIAVGLEVLKTPSMSHEELKQRCQPGDLSQLQQEHKKGNSILLFVSHQNNWEWLNYGISQHTPYVVDPIYKELASITSDKFMYDLRARAGGMPLKDTTALKEVLKNKGTQRLIAIVGDQKPPYRAPKIWVDFLGRETAFFMGGNTMAYATGFPSYYVNCRRVKDGYYTFDFIKIAEAPYSKEDPQVIKDYAAQVEKYVRAYPEDWLWSHDRWKYARREGEDVISKYRTVEKRKRQRESKQL